MAIMEMIWHEEVPQTDFAHLIVDPLGTIYSGGYNKLIRFDHDIVKLLELSQFQESTMVDIIFHLINNPLFKNDLTINMSSLSNILIVLNNPSYQIKLNTISDINAKLPILISDQNKYALFLSIISQKNTIGNARVHFYYTKKNTPQGKFYFVGSSGSPNIICHCPYPNNPPDQNYVNSYITSIKKFPVVNGTSTNYYAAGFLKCANNQLGYLHVDTYYNDPTQILTPNSQQNISYKKRRRFEYSELIRNPSFIREVFKKLKISNNIVEIQSSGPNAGLPTNYLIPNSTSLCSITNYDNIQLTGLIGEPSCGSNSIQICHKSGFTLSGTCYQLGVYDGSGWCEI